MIDVEARAQPQCGDSGNGAGTRHTIGKINAFGFKSSAHSNGENYPVICAPSGHVTGWSIFCV